MRPSCSHMVLVKYCLSRSIQQFLFREHVSEEGEKPVHVLVHYLAHGLIGKNMNAISCTWRKPDL